VLVVLVVGLALAGAVWLGLEFYGEAIDSRSNDQPGAVQSETTQPSAAEPNGAEPNTSP
jgi:hypothetical protein